MSARLSIERLIRQPDEAYNLDSGDDANHRTKLPLAFRRITPYLGVSGVLILVGLVLASIFFTWRDWHWVTFLSGILGAAILSIVSRTIRAEWLVVRRTAQLSLARQKLATETRLRMRAEQQRAGVEDNVKYLHESFPAMLAYVDQQHILKYHNRAFRHGLGATIDHIDGRHLREVVGDKVYGELESDLAGAFAGRVIHRESLQKSTAGETFRLLVQYLPHYNDSGAVQGIFQLSTDITAREDVFAEVMPAASIEVQHAETTQTRASDADESAAERADDEARLRAALDRDEFCLLMQTIAPLAVPADTLPFCEILLRLKNEEENLIPPGSFLPIAEQFGMLPELDRWVVRHLLGWISKDVSRKRGVYSINIAAQTISDRAFPDFVRQSLSDFRLAGSLLCFELQEVDLMQRSADASRMIRQLQPEGCRFALCGFAGTRASFDLLRRVPVNFLKIDGSLILNARRSSVDMTRVTSIHRVAQTIGVSTIAECVEDKDTLNRLRAIGIDFAQGFGISHPQHLEHWQVDTRPDDHAETETGAVAVAQSA